MRGTTIQDGFANSLVQYPRALQALRDYTVCYNEDKDEGPWPMLIASLPMGLQILDLQDCGFQESLLTQIPQLTWLRLCLNYLDPSKIVGAALWRTTFE